MLVVSYCHLEVSIIPEMFRRVAEKLPRKPGGLTLGLHERGELHPDDIGAGLRMVRVEEIAWHPGLNSKHSTLFKSSGGAEPNCDGLTKSRSKKSLRVHFKTRKVLPR
jgi:hypothetical protein